MFDDDRKRQTDRLLGEYAAAFTQDLAFRAQLDVLLAQPSQFLELRRSHRQRIRLACFLRQMCRDPVPQRRLIHSLPARHRRSRIISRQCQLHRLAAELHRASRPTPIRDSFLRHHARIRCPPSRVNPTISGVLERVVLVREDSKARSYFHATIEFRTTAIRQRDDARNSRRSTTMTHAITRGAAVLARSVAIRSVRRTEASV